MDNYDILYSPSKLVEFWLLYQRKAEVMLPRKRGLPFISCQKKDVHDAGKVVK